MPSHTTTGIRYPDKPRYWLVPPWPADASFSDVVRHFLNHHLLWRKPNTAYLLAYFEGYEAALEAAPPDEPANAFHRRWCADMRTSVARCARLYREELTAKLAS